MRNNKPETFTVIYRTGGTERFEWKKCLPVLSREDGETMRSEIERSGYRSLLFRTSLLESIGLPETWD